MEQLHAPASVGDPFASGCGPGLVEMVLRDDGTTDWEDVRAQLTGSYCLLAPKNLVARLAEMRPDAST